MGGFDELSELRKNLHNFYVKGLILDSLGDRKEPEAGKLRCWKARSMEAEG